MLTIDTMVLVAQDGSVSLRLPQGVRPGLHHIVVVMDDADRPPGSPGGEQPEAEVADAVGTDDSQAAAFEAVYARAASGVSG